MKKWACLVLVCVSGVGGCGGSNGGGGAGSGGSGGGGSGGNGGGASVTVSGTVMSAGGHGTGSGHMPLAGATVALAGTSTQTTSAADGSFSLMAPAGASAFISAAVANYQKGQVGIVVGSGGSSGVELQLIPSSDVQAAVSGLAPPLTIDTAKGDLIVQLHDTTNSTTSVPGYGVAISASHGMSFDPNTEMYTSMTSVGAQSSGVVVFPNISPGTSTVMVTPPGGHTCTARQAVTDQRIDAGTFTTVDYDCM